MRGKRTLDSGLRRGYSGRMESFMLIKNGTVITKRGVLPDTDVRVTNGIIGEIGKHLESGDDEILNAAGLYVSPGFIDIHTHGGGGGDFMDCEEDAYLDALRFHAKNGTTALLATSVTAPLSQTVDMIHYCRKFRERDHLPCRILGVHLEGPYLSLKNKGAQHESYLRIPSRDDYSFILENGDIVKRVTVAPELDGAAEMIEKLTACGIVVSGGHDDARYENVLAAIRAGMSHCTHHWCAMSSVAMRNGVREIGLVEAGMLHGELTLEVIADNHHMTPEMIRLLYRCKGADGMCAVSDSLRAGGMPVGDTLYTLGVKNDPGAQKFVVSEGVARLPDGSRYAGSIQPLGQMLRNLIFDCGIPLPEAVKMVSTTPARIMGVDNRIGSVEVGKTADLCLFDDQINICRTIVGGEIKEF